MDVTVSSAGELGEIYVGNGSNSSRVEIFRNYAGICLQYHIQITPQYSLCFLCFSVLSKMAAVIEEFQSLPI